MNDFPNADIRTVKNRLRRELLERRNALSVPERMEAGERVADHLLAHPRLQAASTLLLYHTFRSEVPTEPLLVALTRAGKRLALPHMTTGIRALVAAQYAPGDALEIGPYGVSQPVALHPLPASQLDVVLAPGAAFDVAGGRMGYGKGYYDRFLSAPDLKAWVVGLAFGFQIIGSLPTEPHDRPMDALATEDEVRICWAR